MSARVCSERDRVAREEFNKENYALRAIHSAESGEAIRASNRSELKNSSRFATLELALVLHEETVYNWVKCGSWATN